MIDDVIEPSNDGDSGTCGICGIDPVQYEGVEIGITIINMCEECYQLFKENYKKGR